jgi:hypothetical protein
MLASEQFFSWDARENKAIARLVPALDEAITSGRPTPVEQLHTSLSGKELVKLAVDLCKRAEANVAVLGDGTQALTFVPLFASFVRPRNRVAAPRRERTRQLVGAGALPEVHV